MAKDNPFEESKSWDKSSETKILDLWEKGGKEGDLSQFGSSSGKPLFVIDTPPPYPSGSWHIGAAAQYAEIDMIARAARMSGREVLFPIGIDRNGLPVELYTEKKYNIRMRNTAREDFISLCSTALDGLESEILAILKRLGVSGNYENKYRTDSLEYRTLTQTTFIEQWKKGRIYIGKRPTNYCVDCGTTIADAEIDYKEFPTKLVYFKFTVKGGEEKSEGPESIIIASTRPELLCTCEAIIVHPEDARYSSLLGKRAIIPIYDRDVPIISHPSAKPDYGSGAVMVCSYGDYSDVLLFRELKLPEVIAINTEGKMTATAGEKLAGLRVKQARKQMIEILQEGGLVQKIEDISHRTPTCERSNTPIEIIPLEEYYLKVVDRKNELRNQAGKIRFHPEMHRQILLNWIDVALDWPITRRRFYGTEVPVWYCKSCNTPFLPEAGGYYQPWKYPPPSNPSCPKCGSKEFVGDERTFDTWMDSSVSALFITRFLKNEKFFERTYPTSIRPQGKDIVRTWLHYSLLRCLDITGQAPWRDIWIGGMGLDERGQKMSKSQGNVIDPVKVLDQFGSDNFRLWAASEVSLGSDFGVSIQKISGTGKFLTKLWNIARFASSLPKIDRELSFEEISFTDRWMLSELSKLIEDCRKGYNDYNFFIPANLVRDFTWNVFAAHYIELAKGRAYGQGFTEIERRSAQYTLHMVLRAVLLLLAPICPFITEEIWLRLYSETSIHRETLPEPHLWNTEYLKFGKSLMDFDSLVWNEKKSKKISLKDPVELQIPKDLEGFKKDLIAMHNLKA